jgi:hypothetical protein
MASVSPLAAVTQFRRRAALNRSSPCEYSLAGVEVIHWPGTPAQEIATLTDNKDVMTTLMQRLLHVSMRTTVMVGVVMASVSPLAAVTQFRRRAALNRSSHPDHHRGPQP